MFLDQEENTRPDFSYGIRTADRVLLCLRTAGIMLKKVSSLPNTFSNESQSYTSLAIKIQSWRVAESIAALSQERLQSQDFNIIAVGEEHRCVDNLPMVSFENPNFNRLGANSGIN